MISDFLEFQEFIFRFLDVPNKNGFHFQQVKIYKKTKFENNFGFEKIAIFPRSPLSDFCIFLKTLIDVTERRKLHRCVSQNEFQEVQDKLTFKLQKL